MNIRSNIKDVKKRGYLVNFLEKPLFSINSGLGNINSESSLFDASHRASEISDRIEKYAQKNLFLSQNRLFAAYPSGKEQILKIIKIQDYVYCQKA